MRSKTASVPAQLDTLAYSNEELLTPEEKAKELKVSTSSLYRWRQLGIGPEPIRVGPKLIRYRPGA